MLWATCFLLLASVFALNWALLNFLLEKKNGKKFLGICLKKLNKNQNAMGLERFSIENRKTQNQSNHSSQKGHRRTLQCTNQNSK